MKAAFYRYLPLVVGVILGWFLFSPPSFLPGNAWMRWGIHLVLVVAALVAVIVALVAAGLPEGLRIRKASGKLLEALPALRPLAVQLRELKFAPLGPALEVQVQPPALLLPMMDEQELVVGNLFKPSTVISKVGYDLGSRLAGEASLTSLVDPAGASLPSGPRDFRQVLPGLSPRELLQAHWQGLAYLEALGFPVAPLEPKRYQEQVAKDTADKRRVFFGAPVRHAFAAYWRTLTQRVPCRGPVDSNAETRAKLRALGRRPPTR